MPIDITNSSYRKHLKRSSTASKFLGTIFALVSAALNVIPDSTLMIVSAISSLLSFVLGVVGHCVVSHLRYLEIHRRAKNIAPPSPDTENPVNTIALAEVGATTENQTRTLPFIQPLSLPKRILHVLGILSSSTCTLLAATFNIVSILNDEDILYAGLSAGAAILGGVLDIITSWIVDKRLDQLEKAVIKEEKDQLRKAKTTLRLAATATRTISPVASSSSLALPPPAHSNSNLDIYTDAEVSGISAAAGHFTLPNQVDETQTSAPTLTPTLLSGSSQDLLLAQDQQNNRSSSENSGRVTPSSLFFAEIPTSASSPSSRRASPLADMSPSRVSTRGTSPLAADTKTSPQSPTSPLIVRRALDLSRSNGASVAQRLSVINAVGGRAGTLEQPASPLRPQPSYAAATSSSEAKQINAPSAKP